MKEQAVQLQKQKPLIEQKTSTLADKLSQRIAMLESENLTLRSQNLSLQEDCQLFQEQFSECMKVKDSLRKEYQSLQEHLTNCQEERQMLHEQLTNCREERQTLQQQLTKLQKENERLLTAQEESVAFGIEPWKVPRDRVELGRLIGGGGWGAVNEGKLKVAIKQIFPNILSEHNLARLQREM